MQLQQWGGIIEWRGTEERKWPWTELAHRLLVTVSVFRFCGGVTKSLRGKVILRLWLCQQATNPHTKLSWPGADCLQHSQLRHTPRHLYACAQFVSYRKYTLAPTSSFLQTHKRKPAGFWVSAFAWFKIRQQLQYSMQVTWDWRHSLDRYEPTLRRKI